jgi:hypothetical protein
LAILRRSTELTAEAGVVSSTMNKTLGAPSFARSGAGQAWLGLADGPAHAAGESGSGFVLFQCHVASPCPSPSSGQALKVTDFGTRANSTQRHTEIEISVIERAGMADAAGGLPARRRIRRTSQRRHVRGRSL